RRRARARGGAEARPARVPARARVVLPRGDGRAAGGAARCAADPPPGLASPCRCTPRALQVAAGGGPTRAAGRAHHPGRRLYPRPLGCRPGPAGPAGGARPPAADGWPVTPRDAPRRAYEIAFGTTRRRDIRRVM